MSRQRYTEEFKIEAVKQVTEELSSNLVDGGQAAFLSD